MLKSLIVALFLMSGSTAHSQNIDFGTASFLPGWSESDGSLIAAIQIDLNPGWKTYWRVPGQAGIPPNFNWTGSQNFRGAEVMYPTPKVENVAGFLSIGYHEQVVFPIRIQADNSNQPVDITLQFTFGACEEICIPVEKNFSIRLDPNQDENRALIQSALDDAPRSAKSAGVISAECSISPAGKDFLLSASIQMKTPPKTAPFVVFEPGSSDFWVDLTQTTVEGTTLTAQAPMQFYGDGGLVLERSKIRLTLLGEGYAIDIQGCPA